MGHSDKFLRFTAALAAGAIAVPTFTHAIGGHDPHTELEQFGFVNGRLGGLRATVTSTATSTSTASA